MLHLKYLPKKRNVLNFKQLFFLKIIAPGQINTLVLF